MKQIWTVLDGRSKPWDIGELEGGDELKERWGRDNGMAAGEVRLMAEWKLVGWNELAELEDGTTVQVLGNVCG